MLASAYFLAALLYACARPLLALLLDVPTPLHTQLCLFAGPQWDVLIAFWLAMCAVWIPYFLYSKRARAVYSVRFDIDRELQSAPARRNERETSEA